MTIVSIFRGGDFRNLAGWYSYFFGTIIRHTRVGSKIAVMEKIFTQLLSKLSGIKPAYVAFMI